MTKLKESTDYLIRNTKKGRGLFANKTIKKGSVILKVKGNAIPFSETLKLKDKESFCLQIDINTYLKPQYPFYLINHSCSPNCGIDSNLELFAMESIRPGEELCWDYSTSMLERSWSIKCICGTKECRRRITDFDILPPAVQKAYISSNIVLPFILRYLEIINKRKG